jgi:hypothetical protein
MRTILICLLFLAAAPGASLADTRYVSPTGSAGASCAQLDPCSFKTAVEGAVGLDVVVVAPGTYNVSGQVDAFTTTNLDIHGAVGQPRPDVRITGPSNAASFRIGALAKVSHLDITCLTGDVSCLYTTTGASVSDVSFVATAGGGSYGLTISSGGSLGSSVSNVTVRASGLGIDLTDTNAEVRNATLVGGTEAISISNSSGSARTVTLRNVILKGGNRSGEILGAQIVANVDYSALGILLNDPTATVTLGQHNVASVPQFVSSTDLHQAAGSPTVDKGLADFFTPDTDMDGDARPLGLAVDIGADEFRSLQVATTTAATAITSAGTTLNGTIDRRGETVQYQFEYGPTTAYGHVTPIGTASGTGAQPVSAPITGLSPTTAYHYRLLTVNSYSGSADGLDQTFTTSDPPPADPPAVQPGPADPAAGDPPSGEPTIGPVDGPSAAVKRCVVPSLRGLSLKRARTRLRHANCRLGKVRGRRPGHVRRQSAKPGRRLKRGTRVDVTVS